jgi:Xaa-Pro aminopeptidase
MTMIDHGPEGQSRQLGGLDVNRPGVGELITSWALHGGHFTAGLTARAAAGVVRNRDYKRVGLVNSGAIPHGFVSGLHDALDGAVAFTDETDFFDHVKACKSAEEIELIRGTAAIQDQVFSKLLNWITPGKRDFEVNAFLDYQLQLLGADRGVYIATSAPIGSPSLFGYRAVQGRLMERGDHINVLLESNGLGGEWTELGRLIAFGKVDARTREAHEICLEAQRTTARRLVPGADPVEICVAHNDFMASHGSEPERRIHSHGQGYDAVERPFIRADETMKLASGMNLAVHPCYVGGPVFATVCDNVIVGDQRGANFLHATPKEIFEL